jgi:CRP-like cAMP-binding protein
MVSVDELCPCELFAGLSDDELAQIARITHKETYSAGDLILIESEQAERLFILCRGRVQIDIQLRSSLEPSGGTTIEEVEPGRIFGWSSLVKQRRLTASVRALDPVTVLYIKADNLLGLFDQNAHIGFVVMKQLAEVIASRLRRTRELFSNTGQDAEAERSGEHRTIGSEPLANADPGSEELTGCC